ncbi:NIPSNAP family protein [Foetidibacter luteolus]|uniref:NIPSNAP family protein n=1 Tax=Foetidibacter luteolus TaxID=2608880 RepID=UPI00129B66A3|nr:NIPSNAP family protein [Foetidibacter luteolus]
MKRRQFVKSALLTGAMAGITSAQSIASMKKKNNPQEYYELRIYTLKNNAQLKLTENYFEQALIPALNRLGINNIGVFTEQLAQEFTKLFAVIPFTTVEDYMHLDEKLATDSAYLAAAAPYLDAPATAPAYERIQSSLLKAFAQMPQIQVPEKKDRIFELRRYESSSEVNSKKKIEMFNDAGEIRIFKRTGLTPVFFGETVIGEARPNLTYMLTFDNMEAHDLNWKTFINDPEWKKVSSQPEYANERILSNIRRTFLVPAKCSQV